MRYKEFNVNQILEKCIHLFWKNGYTGSSIQDIVTYTRVQRFSLYNEFENKRGILLAAMNLYHERYATPRLEILNQKGDAREIMHTFMASFLDESPDHPSGCFYLYIATELADHDPEIKDMLENYLNEIEDKMKALFDQDPKTKDNSEFLARHFVGHFCKTMCFCVILSKEEQLDFLNNGMDLLLKTA